MGDEWKKPVFNSRPHAFSWCLFKLARHSALILLIRMHCEKTKSRRFFHALKNLTPNKITDGRNKSEQVASTRIFVGSAFIPPPDAIIISKLDDSYSILLPTNAQKLNDTTAVFSGNGLVNGHLWHMVVGGS